MIRKMVVHCQRAAYDVLIDRTTKWGNIFTSISDRPTRAQIVVKTRAESLERHEVWLRHQPPLIAQLHELRDKVLGCHCDPFPCHGHTLIRLIDELCLRCDRALRAGGALCAACTVVRNPRGSLVQGDERSSPMNDRCQVTDCSKDATYHAFPANAAHPDEGGMQTCDDHLSEGMSHLSGQPAPEYWRVFPLHEGSPPYCAATCPTCHPKDGGSHVPPG